MADWGFLGALFEAMQTHSPLLGRLWLQIMLVFRMLILGTVATDLFEDEQEQFECNTAQPGCKQVCYDQAFPISQYRFWVFHIVLISTPALLFLMYAMHLNSKNKDSGQDRASASYGLLSMDPTASSSQIKPSMGKPGAGASVGTGINPREDRRVMHLYMLNVGFRFLAEVAFLVGQWALYGFRVSERYPCSRFPCPYTVDCFSSRPMEKTVFLCFYFAVGLLSALFSLAELLHVFIKWRRLRQHWRRGMTRNEELDIDGFGKRDLMPLGAQREGEGDGGADGLERRPCRDRSVDERGRRGSGGGRRPPYIGKARSGGTSGSTSSGRGKVRVTLGRTASTSSISRNNSSSGYKNHRSSSQQIHMV